MPQLPLDIVRRLEEASFEMSEIYEARSPAIGVALGQDRAFTQTKVSRSSLTRDLVGDAFLEAMSHVGLPAQRGTGGACEIVEYMNGWYAVIRMRTAERRGDGSYFVRKNKASSFGYVDESMLEPNHDFVFGFTIDDGELNCFVAPVIRVIEGNPGELVLGDAIEFGGVVAPELRGFATDPDETLPGMEDEGVQDEGAGEDSRSA